MQIPAGPAPALDWPQTPLDACLRHIAAGGRVRVPTSRSRIAVLIVCAAGMTALCAVLLVIFLTSVEDPDGMGRAVLLHPVLWACILGIVLFGAGIVLGLVGLVRPRRQLVLDGRGLTEAAGATVSLSIPWTDIECVYGEKIGGNYGFDGRYHPHYVLTAAGLDQLNARITAAGRGASAGQGGRRRRTLPGWRRPLRRRVVIMHPLYTGGPRRLVDLLTAVHAQATGR